MVSHNSRFDRVARMAVSALRWPGTATALAHEVGGIPARAVLYGARPIGLCDGEEVVSVRRGDRQDIEFRHGGLPFARRRDRG